MGITQPFLRQTCEVVIQLMRGAYPLLDTERDRILAEWQKRYAK